MRSPKDMIVIDIDITNACVHRCSNCTRFCGHHRKPFFMDFETFKKAVDSLEDYDGCVGIIGGEPTLHPQIEEFSDYIREHRLKKFVTYSREPISNMAEHLDKYLTEYEESKTGFWSSISRSYYKHFETINDSYEAQCLNDHNNSCMHQSLLMARKDLGITDDEWIQKRDACWIQNQWSATITPKGAFFCEVAGALDMLFDGPGGWELTKDWWKREVKDFKDQLHWCEICSGSLDVPQRLSTDGRDDVTPTLLKKLQDIKSPKIQRGEYILWDKNNYDKSKYKTFTGSDDYMEISSEPRTSSKNRNIYPKNFTFCKSENLENILSNTDANDWITVSENEEEAKKIANKLKDYIINPGCLYTYEGNYIFNVTARSIRNKKPHDISELQSFYPQSKIIKINNL